MKSNNSDQFQRQLATFLCRKLEVFNIEKKKFGNMINVSNVFVTRITTYPGKVPSPSLLRKIEETLTEHFNDEEIEQELSELIKKYANEDYAVKYYFEKLKSVYDHSSKLISFLKEQTKQLKI